MSDDTPRERAHAESYSVIRAVKLCAAKGCRRLTRREFCELHRYRPDGWNGPDAS